MSPLHRTARWLHQDRQGSVIAWSNSAGSVSAGTVYKYGPWGEPGDNWASGASRFRYTGQIAIPEARLYHYKARMYDPATGRFMQTDPIGYKDDLDLYAYVGGDPVNRSDPTGLASCDNRTVKGQDCANAMAANRIIITRGSAAISGARAWVASQAPGGRMTPEAQRFARRWAGATKEPLTVRSAGVFVSAVRIQVAVAANRNNLIEVGQAADGWDPNQSGAITTRDGRISVLGGGNFQGPKAVGKLAFTLGHEYFHNRNFDSRGREQSGVGHYSNPINIDEILSIEGIPDVR